MSKVIKGPVFVVQDNIDTDQIIPAQYLNLIPTIAEEYEKLGSYALCGLPDSLIQNVMSLRDKRTALFPSSWLEGTLAAAALGSMHLSRWVRLTAN